MSDETATPWEDNWQAQKVLSILQQGPASTIELQDNEPLVHVARQIWELRHWYGYRIKTSRLPNKVALYALETGMNVAIVGSRDINVCSCDAQEKHWPPTPDEKVHAEVCPKVQVWLLMLKVVGRLAVEGATIITTDSREGADKLAGDAAEMMGVPVRSVKLPAGREPIWERANKRNTTIIKKVDRVIAVCSPGDIRPGILDLLQKAEAKGIPVHLWKEGGWS